MLEPRLIKKAMDQVTNSQRACAKVTTSEVGAKNFVLETYVWSC